MTLAINVIVKGPLKFSWCKLSILGSHPSTDHWAKTLALSITSCCLCLSRDTESCLSLLSVSIPGKDKVLNV